MADRPDLELARGIVHRLHRMLQGLDRARRNPNRREAYHISSAIEHVHAGRLAQGEEAMRRAERVDPLPPDIAAQTILNEPTTVTQLRAMLDQVTRNQPL
jgi:hypothetical protein